jgi:uncharacterized membrane protein
MLYAALKAVHFLSVIVWLGGMFFALFCLRPGAAHLPPPERVPLMQAVLQRFFSIVLWVALVTVLSGGLMVGRVASTTQATGGPFNMPLEWTVMAGLGVLMVAIFGHIRFALFKRVQRASAARDWPAAGAALKSIRDWVAVNLTIGVVIVVVVIAGTMT